MDQDLISRGHPLGWELTRRRIELMRLERELAEREAALADYESELAAFQARYFQALAGPYAVLDELEAQAAEKAAQLRPDDATKRRKAERLRAQADAHANPRPPEPAPAPRPKPADDVRKLFREVSKLVHPDLASEPAERERREGLMRQANAAYAAGDAPTLAYLLGHWESETAPSEEVEATLALLERQIARVEARLSAPSEARSALEATELAKLMERAKVAERQGRDFLARMVKDVEAAQQEARKRIKTFERRLAKQADRT